MITYEEFLSIVKDDLGLYVNFDPDPRNHRRDKKAIARPAIGDTWVTGGQCGGSCWDTGDEDNHRPLDSEPEPDLKDLHRILEHVCPSLSFLCYTRLQRELIKVSDGFGYSEYYGNYTNASGKYVYMDELYKFLENEKLLPSSPPAKPETKDD
jgi:hypothetical protein